MVLQEKLIVLALEYGPKVIGAIVLLIIGLWIIKGIMTMVGKSLEKSRLDISLHSFVKSVVSFALKVMLLITIAAMLGIPMTTFIAILSAAGLAIGLALKDSLANFAGGILILTFRPFNVGDFIETQGYMGTVKEIQLLYSYINTPDNKRVVIPNGELANAKLVNFSAENIRRVDFVFAVGYNDDIIKVKEVLAKLVSEHPLIMKEPEAIIGVTQHADNSVNFDVKVWCASEDYWDIYYDMHERVKIKFDAEGITIPYPQRDVHLYQK